MITPQALDAAKRFGQLHHEQLRREGHGSILPVGSRQAEGWVVDKDHWLVRKTNKTDKGCITEGCHDAFICEGKTYCVSVWVAELLDRGMKV